MSSRSLWGVGWMGPPGSAGGQSLGDGSWQWTLGQKALRRSAVDANVRTTTEQRGGFGFPGIGKMRTRQTRQEARRGAGL